MNKCIIIAGYAGIGKTTLAKKYKNVYDIESSIYKWDNSECENIPIEQRKGTRRKQNPLWPQNYINEIQNKSRIYDILLVWIHPDILEIYDKYNISYIICYPEKEALKIYKQRFISRGNNKEYIDKVTDPKKFDIRTKQWNENPSQKIILRGNQTLEDYLIKKGCQLIEK